MDEEAKPDADARSDAASEKINAEINADKTRDDSRTGESALSEAAPESAATNDAASDDAVSGDAPSGNAADAASDDNAVKSPASGDIAPEDAVSGDAASDDIISGGAASDNKALADAAPEDSASGETAPEDAVQGGAASDDDASSGGIASDDAISVDDAAPDKAASDNAVQGESDDRYGMDDLRPPAIPPASVMKKARSPATAHIVVDGTELVAGRLASIAAKRLLKGDRISIVNCENIMLSGNRSNIIKEYRDFLEISSIIHPKHGPFHPRRPDTMITRMVRGMLPRKKPSGRAAHKRLRAYIGVPKQLKSVKKVRFDGARIKKPAAYYTTMADLGRTIGWTE